jgi:hypothetical protein
MARSLFILHQANLALPINLTTDESRQRSWGVLNTATNIVVDIAQSHTEKAHCLNHSHLTLPLCCARNVRDAEQYVGNVHFYRNTNVQAEVSKYLEVLEQTLVKEWRLPADSMISTILPITRMTETAIILTFPGIQQQYQR